MDFDHYLEPGSTYKNRITCVCCGLLVLSDSTTTVQVAALNHVIRAHPAEYQDRMGYDPDEEQEVTEHLLYGIMEGFMTVHDTPLTGWE